MIEQYDIADICTASNGYKGEIGNKELRADQRFMLEQCDINFGIFGDSQKAKTVCPTKLVTGLAFGIPTITARTDSLPEFFDGSEICIIGNTPEEIAQAVKDVLGKTRSEIENMVAKGSQRYEKYFSDEAFQIKAKDILKSL